MGERREVVFDVRRVDGRFWTWHFEKDGVIRLGAGSRSDAVTATNRFLAEIGARSLG